MNPVIYAGTSKLKYKNSAINIEKIVPNVAANLLGGANIGLGLKFKRLVTPLAINASGDVILVNDLIAKSIARNSARIYQLKVNVTTVTIITWRATILITFSFK
jgi:hypothetical protein